MNVNRRNPASLSRPGIPLISPEFGSVEDEVMEIKEQAELALEDAELAMDRVERAIVKKVDVATSVQNHRKFLYMLGAPVLIYAGLTNKNRPTVGKIAALIGAFVGLRNYRAFSLAEGASAAMEDDLAGLGRTSGIRPVLQSDCIPPRRTQNGLRCHRGRRLRIRNGRKVCCR
jgi:hypothetical protein